ncbi:hypothetical protein Afil01_61560 [Actinorhabdospora filicis]|uniref:Nucleotidyltransferase domain-containing protein n=1 Tax=Actinorhabdospora filicis TaxID=1785913 RepID=A0A9W6WC71_9ACTN|nr:hypothetical protein [Actinorhabdospora filicis]GLZ81349.1 hypothetical protein Afil01_61560 [Actinorhabdospora filicis]
MTDPRQAAVIDRARTVLPQDERVLAVYLVGSHASHEDDAYSDVDVHVVVTDEAAETYDFATAMESIAGRLVLTDGIPGLSGGLGITPDWLHVDLIVHPLSEYDPDDYEAVLPLFDRSGNLLPEARVPGGNGDPYYPRRNVRLFFYFLGNLVNVLGRREYVVANMGVSAVRDQLIALMRAERGVRRSGGVKRLNAFVSDEQREFLESIPAVGCEPKDIIAANQMICREFIRRGTALAAATGEEWPQEFVDATLTHLREAFGVEFG